LDAWTKFLEDEPEPEPSYLDEVFDTHASIQAHEYNKKIDEKLLKALG
jgi:hypothetical protein